MGDCSYGASGQDIARYRYKAEQCRRQAAQSALSPVDQECWLRLAEDWTKMARVVERRLSRE
jgi:hypothetical protein